MTIEEAKLKLMSIDTIDDKTLYNAICVAIEALEKQMPKKPKEKQWLIMDKSAYGYCPICGDGMNSEMNYCDHCGQKIDWGDNNDS